MSIIHKLCLSFLFPNFPHPFILSAERFGISLFYKELDFTKNRLVEFIAKVIGDIKKRESKSLCFISP